MRTTTSLLVSLALVAGLLLVGPSAAMAEEVEPPPEPEPTTSMVIVGGSAVISAHSEAHLASCLPTTRLSGSDRFATARAVSSLRGSTGGTVYVAQGHTFADALPAGAAANSQGSALVLVEKNSVPSSAIKALDALAPEKVVIVGGPAVVAESVEAQLADRYGTVQRLSGADRYSTAVAVSGSSHPDTAEAVILATGEAFIDALSASPLAAHLNAPLLLVAGGNLPDVVSAELERLAPSQIYIIGGTAVIPSSLETDIGEVLPETAVSRLAGKDRYSTARAVANLLPESPELIIGVTAYNFPDALAAGAVARTNPLVLLDEKGLSPVSADLVEDLSGSRCEPIVKLSSFTTYYTAGQSRVTNIQRIADEADNAVIAPDGTFSLNDHVGQRTLADGYVPAGAIVGGALVCCDHPANVGGGTSQFATTLYNAIFYAGLDDVSHRPHSVYFSRYPLGIEATLNWISPDVVFRNDTEWPLSIDSHYTSTSITVDLWGWSDNREVAKQVTGEATTAEGGRVKVERWITHSDGTTDYEAWYHTYKPLQEEPEEDDSPPPTPDPEPDPDPDPPPPPIF